MPYYVVKADLWWRPPGLNTDPSSHLYICNFYSDSPEGRTNTTPELAHQMARLVMGVLNDKGPDYRPPDGMLTPWELQQMEKERKEEADGKR